MKKPFAIACLVSALASGPLFAATDILLRERCHQGECTFTKFINTRTIGRNAGGSMMEVKSRSATLPIPSKVDDPSTMRLPKNYGLVRVIYIYCSTEKPALIFYDKKFYAHFLKIGEPPTGNQIDSHIEYWAACHNRVVSVGDVTEGKLAKDAAELGYGKFPKNWGAQRDFRNKKKAFQFFGL